MIYVTGDTHGNFERFKLQYFPEQADMTKDDVVIVCGDFGAIWDNSKNEDRELERLEQLPFTLLFVDGNHENFDILKRYPQSVWNGGKVHFIKPHVIHLMRGQVFDLQGYTFFTMDGGKSHDIGDGILDQAAPDFIEICAELKAAGRRFRINHKSWWKEELPSEEEYEEAARNLEKINWQPDYIISHSAPSSLLPLIGSEYKPDRLTDFLDTVSTRGDYHYWFSGIIMITRGFMSAIYSCGSKLYGYCR